MKRRALITLFSFIPVVWAFSQADLQPAAIVNLIRSEPISVKQLRTEVETQEQTTRRALNPQERRTVLDMMINERLILQAAERDKITVSDNEVTQQINQFRAQLVQTIGREPTEAEFATAVRNQTGLDMTAFREQLRRQLIYQRYITTKKQSTFESIKVPTEQEIAREYNLRRSQLVRPDTVRFSMIQVPYGPDAASRTRARELADRLSREIGSSSSKFKEVVDRSYVPNSGYQGGDGGYLPMNPEAAQIVGQEFMNVAFNLKVNEISKVIEGQLGYQIITITEAHAMKSLELDDVFRLEARMTVRDYIGNAMLQERQMEALTKATQELIAELRAGKTFQVFERNLTW